MTAHASKSTSFASSSASDLSLSSTNHESSLIDQTKADELQTQSSIQHQQSIQDQTLSHEEHETADAYQIKYQSEIEQSNVLAAKVTSEEIIFEQESEKATAEQAAASKYASSTETDGMTTGLCEFIPFVDVVCDFIGGITAVGFESNAARLEAQAAMDATAASSVKAEEDADLATVDSLRAEAEEDNEMMSSMTTTAKEEQLKAEEEEMQSEEERLQAQEETQKSQAAETLSEEEQTKAQEEQSLAEEQMEKSVQEGLYALKDALLSTLFASMVFSFFAIRFCIAFVVPGAISILGFLFMVVTTRSSVTGVTASSSANAAVTTCSSHTATRTATILQSFQLPKREISYFALHCGVYLTTLSIFCSRFTSLDSYDVRSKGGVVLSFALVASCNQGVLLHVIPQIVNYLHWIKLKSTSVSVTKQTQTTTTTATPTVTTIFSTPSCIIITQSILKLIQAILYLTPLFVMETISLWLILGKCILTFTLPPPFNLINVGIIVWMFCLFHVFVYELHQLDELEGERGGDDCNKNYGDSHDNGEDDLERGDNDNHYNNNRRPRPTREIANTNESLEVEVHEDIMNETNALLANDFNQNYTNYHQEEKAEVKTKIKNVNHSNFNHVNDVEQNSSCHENKILHHHDHAVQTIELYQSNHGDISQMSAPTNENKNVDANAETGSASSSTVFLSAVSVAMVSERMCEEDNDNDDIIDDDNDNDDDNHNHGDYQHQQEHLSNLTESLNHDDSQTTSNEHEFHVQIENTTTTTPISTTTKTTTTTGTKTTTTIQKLSSVIQQYMSDLKLPFEILIITCMYKLLSGCMPILSQLLPKFIEHHTHFFVEVGCVVVLVCGLLYVCIKNHNDTTVGHFGIWTGSALRRWSQQSQEEHRYQYQMLYVDQQQQQQQQQQ